MCSNSSFIAFSGVFCCYSWRRGVLSRISERLTCEHNPNGPKTSFTALPGFGSPPALCAASRRALEGFPRRLYTWETTCQLLLLNDAAGWRRVYPCVRTDYKIRAKKQQQAPGHPSSVCFGSSFSKKLSEHRRQQMPRQDLEDPECEHPMSH